MKDLLPVVNSTGIVAALSFFLWWKSTLAKEVVQPEIEKLEMRIKFLEEQVSKQENLQLRLQENLEGKVDRLQETISNLIRQVAKLSGQLEAMGQK